MKDKSIKRPKPVVLIVLDGWGVAPSSSSNAITLAKTPTINQLITTYPAMTLQASGEAVGLRWGEMGNSEVGHLNMGAGKIFYQDLPRITQTINNGSFFKNPAFLEAINHLKKNGFRSKLHLLGLVSVGGVHSSDEHLFALLELAKKYRLPNVYIQAILDGRDTTHNGALEFIEKLEAKIKKLKIGKIATLSGRFYAMDRDNYWERIEKTYQALVEGVSKDNFSDPKEAIKNSYQRQIFDEEFIPTVITKDNEPVAKIEDGDAVIFFNFRADRARELTKAFVLPGFDKFKIHSFKNLFFVTMTEYDKDLPVDAVAFSPEKITNTLTKIISESHLKQLHIAETEKYAHVTYFFSGGQEKPVVDEDQILIPSPRLLSYDKKPEMSAEEINRRVIREIQDNKYDFILINFANADMVGHTGNLEATIQAVEVVDSCLEKIVKTVLEKNGVIIITADHGNAEELVKIQTGFIDKEHSTNMVPFILVGKQWEGQTMAEGVENIGVDLSLVRPVGVLADITPTILKIMGLKKPKEMTARSLI